jgi:hypothetical protein
MKFTILYGTQRFFTIFTILYGTQTFFTIFTILYGTQRFFTIFAMSPLMVFVLSQLNPVHTFRYYFLKMYFNIILHFMNTFGIHGSVHRSMNQQKYQQDAAL